MLAMLKNATSCCEIQQGGEGQQRPSTSAGRLSLWHGICFSRMIGNSGDPSMTHGLPGWSPPRTCPSVARRRGMSIVLTLKFITALALYVQLLMLIYLYSSHRERFFRYMVWAWGLFVVSKGASIIQQFFPEATATLPLFNAVGSAGDLFVLAAGLAYRGAYRLRWSHVALGIAYAIVSVVPGTTADLGLDMPVARRAVGGCAFLVAGWAFWPPRATAAAQPGAKLLATALILWGLHRVVRVFVDVAPESSVFVPLHAVNAGFYFLSALAIVWLVLNRARGEVAALEDFNRRLVDGLGE